uniref:Major facilitator superfamily (MFS) profile domain-containing protein n=1 Tax=Acrobeloides nanus TaxID=290746 RepID=A0A914C4Q0_9BILA
MSQKRIVDCDGTSSTGSGVSSTKSQKSRIFPSTRFFMAILLCCCFISLSVSTSNISVSMVCMVRKHGLDNQSNYEIAQDIMRIKRSLANDSKANELFLGFDVDFDENDTISWSNNQSSTPISRCALARIRRRAIEVAEHPEMSDWQRVQYDDSVQVESCDEHGLLDWTSADQGIVFAAQNAGSLLMLITGAQADRLNGKWTIVAALLLLILSNVLIPVLAYTSMWLVVLARVLTGFSDSLLQPSTSSMITRWFPPKERPFAIGLITGGRQIGTLIILPLAGFLCQRKDILDGWPAIFYLSTLICSGILIIWLFMSADKPSKHFCISPREQDFVEKKIEEERIGKRKERKAIPWRKILTCRPLYVAIAALICHEYPLVIMLQLLPTYINDVLKFSTFTNGIVSALPIAVLWISKTLSSSLSSLIGSRKRGRFVIGRTPLVKIFNGIASLGLGVCVAIVPLLNHQAHHVTAIVVLCCANMFAGMHTPGVQTALLQIAPAYTGIITGIAFGFVAIFSIINKVISNIIVKDGSIAEWTIVFEIAAFIAVTPVLFFTLWGSAERQSWATQKSATAPKISAITPTSKYDPQYVVGLPRDDANDYALASDLRLSIFLADDALAEEDRAEKTKSDEDAEKY